MSTQSTLPFLAVTGAYVRTTHRTKFHDIPADLSGYTGRKDPLMSTRTQDKLDTIIGHVMNIHEDLVGYCQDLDEIRHFDDAESLRSIVTMIEDWRYCVRDKA